MHLPNFGDNFFLCSGAAQLMKHLNLVSEWVTLIGLDEIVTPHLN
jgi:hypothetical protein